MLPCVLRALAFEYWDAESLFSYAERMDATRRRCNMSSHSGSSGGIGFGDFPGQELLKQTGLYRCSPKKGWAVSQDPTHKFPDLAPNTPPLSQLASARGGDAIILNWTQSLANFARIN
jgi:hypothetical protein